jgi:hypothetical protein
LRVVEGKGLLVFDVSYVVRDLGKSSPNVLMDIPQLHPLVELFGYVLERRDLGVRRGYRDIGLVSECLEYALFVVHLEIVHE